MNKRQIFDKLINYANQQQLKVEFSDDVNIANGNSWFSPDERKLMVPSEALIFDDGKNQELYYFSTFCHEFGHSTMLPLGRKPKIEDLAERAKEELVAELTAFLICSELDDISNYQKKILELKNITYLSSWAKNAEIKYEDMTSFNTIYNKALAEAQQAKKLLLGGAE